MTRPSVQTPASAIPLPYVVFLASEQSANDARSLGAAMGGEEWEPLVIHWPDPGALLATRDRTVAAVVVMTGEPVPDMASAFGRPVRVPVVAVGSRPPDSADVAYWMRTPCPVTLRNVIASSDAAKPRAARLVPPNAAGRRKSDAIIGQSNAIAGLLRLIDLLSTSAAPVLVNGESGAGKDLVARALHFGCPRATEPFVALNCAALPEALFESELFGHERGAFTGAVSARAGAFESADRGTLFLDEIAEAPLSVQAKLLRVLDNGDFTRLGSTHTRHTTARIVFATNRDLAAEVACGRFREDLYYRVSVHTVRVPSLRERIEDVPAIARHHLSLIARRENRPIPRLSATALEKLVSHGWPGNVRELMAALERAFLLAQDGVIGTEHIALAGSADAPGPIHPYREAKESFERSYYSRVMEASHGNVTMAARLAQKTRKEIYDALKKLDLDPVSFRPDEP